MSDILQNTSTKHPRHESAIHHKLPNFPKVYEFFAPQFCWHGIKFDNGKQKVKNKPKFENLSSHVIYFIRAEVNKDPSETNDRM